MSNLPKPSIITYKTKLFDGKTVEFRPMLMKEQKLMMMAQEEPDATKDAVVMDAIRTVIKSCLITDIDLSRIPSFDIEHLLLQIRQKSVGSTVKVNIKHFPDENNPRDCDPCKFQTETTIDLSKANLVKDADLKTVFEFGGGFGVEMTFPTIEVFNRMREFSHTPKAIEIVIEIIAACVSRIFSGDNVYDAKDFTTEEIIDWLSNFDFSVIDEINENFIMKMPYIEIKHTWKCSQCGLEETTKIRGIFDFFR